MSGQIKITLENICPYVRNAGKGIINWQGRIRKIYDYQLMYFVHGKGVYFIGDDEYTITSGCIILIKPNTAHTLIFEDNHEYLWVHFDFFYREDAKMMTDYLRKEIRYNNMSELFKDTLPHTEWIREQPDFDESFLFPDYIVLKEHEIIESLFRKLLFEHSNKNIAYEIKCKAILLNIFAEIIQQLFEDKNIKTNYSNFKTFYKLINYIEKNYFKKITLSDLENIAGLSGDYISRIFKEKTSYSAKEYINNFRIKKAKDLFVHEDLKISDVASMIGFDDIHYFSKVFKKYEGVSPKDYRKIYFSR